MTSVHYTPVAKSFKEDLRKSQKSYIGDLALLME